MTIEDFQSSTVDDCITRKIIKDMRILRDRVIEKLKEKMNSWTSKRAQSQKTLGVKIDKELCQVGVVFMRVSTFCSSLMSPSHGAFPSSCHCFAARSNFHRRFLSPVTFFPEGHLPLFPLYNFCKSSVMHCGVIHSSLTSHPCTVHVGQRHTIP